MSLLERLSDAASWEKFYKYRTSLISSGSFNEALRSFIDEQGYIPVCERISSGEDFPLPKRSVISKLSTQKKRTVYTYPFAENMVLKLLTYLILRKYDGLFSDGLYSFRPGRSAKDAVQRLIRIPGIDKMYSYKVDIHDYFNSIDVELLLPMLEVALADDPQLFGFLRSLLKEDRVVEGKKSANEANIAEGSSVAGHPLVHDEHAVIHPSACDEHAATIFDDHKGIMAGTPIASFYANLFLSELDRHFAESGVIYARYSDDIIVFAKSREETEAHAAYISEFLREKHLTVNPEKECFAASEEGWTFLGFSYKDGIIDIAPATIKKLKQKMRRKARSLDRWRKRKGASGENAATAFIKTFNRKLLESPEDNELSWSFWFFSMINTDKSLHEIDLYAQDCLRFLISGTRTKARYNIRYDDLKALGYKSLVHHYRDGSF